MEPNSNDRWVAFRVAQMALGKRLLGISNELNQMAALSTNVRRLIEIPGLVWARNI